jgi:hypothetical protein
MKLIGRDNEFVGLCDSPVRHFENGGFNLFIFQGLHTSAETRQYR